MYETLINRATAFLDGGKNKVDMCDCQNRLISLDYYMYSSSLTIISQIDKKFSLTAVWSRL